VKDFTLNPVKVAWGTAKTALFSGRHEQFL